MTKFLEAQCSDQDLGVTYLISPNEKSWRKELDLESEHLDSGSVKQKISPYKEIALPI